MTIAACIIFAFALVSLVGYAHSRSANVAGGRAQPYSLPSLESCPDTNHKRVRQICAEIDGIVYEEAVSAKRAGIKCPKCLHSIEYHRSAFCDFEFFQTDRNGIKKHVRCFCLMHVPDIELNA